MLSTFCDNTLYSGTHMFNEYLYILFFADMIWYVFKYYLYDFYIFP